ncbi:MAG: CDP-diacylglycerol--serine O-phosphatidyltransferase [Mariprofundaceae bacterium]
MTKKKIMQRGIYLLPSLFTTAGLFSGFYALIAAIQGHFEVAAWAIIVAVIFDILDGRVARALHAESSFGAEYDSLCDMVSFGVVPAVLTYLWALTVLEKPGWLAAFMIAACAALRLARFNTQVGHADKRYFQGLPTPATALFIATSILFHTELNLEPLPWLWFVLTISLAWLMVSRVRFVSGKDINLQERHPFAALTLMVAILVFVMINPYITLFVLTLSYCAHGPVMSIWQRQKAIRHRILRRKKRLDKS